MYKNAVSMQNLTNTQNKRVDGLLFIA